MSHGSQIGEDVAAVIGLFCVLLILGCCAWRCLRRREQSSVAAITDYRITTAVVDHMYAKTNTFPGMGVGAAPPQWWLDKNPGFDVLRLGRNLESYHREWDEVFTVRGIPCPGTSSMPGWPATACSIKRVIPPEGGGTPAHDVERGS